MASTDRLVWRALGHGPRAWLAKQRLLRAGERGDVAATDALWDLWLLTWDHEVWAALSRWRRPQTEGGKSLVALSEPADVADVIDAATSRVLHPIANIARATILEGNQELVDAACEKALTDENFAPFCIEHGLAPADPHRAAVYFLLTGQVERYRLVDPDHTLLAAAYRSAEEKERDRVRAEVAGEPDLVLVLVDATRRDRMARLTEREAGYLTGQLAKRRDWLALWTLAKDLPVRQAVHAARLIDGWRPGTTDEDLFHAIAGADPKAIDKAYGSLGKPWLTRLDVPGFAVDGSFSPDGRRFAVAHTKGVDVFAMPTGTHEPENSRTGGSIRAVLVRDDAQMVTAGVQANRWRTSFVERGGGNRPVSRTLVPGEAVALARRPGGFAVLTVTRTNIWLRLQDDDGRHARTVSVRTDTGILTRGSPELVWALAGDPGSGRMALAGDRLYLLEPTDSMVRVLAAATPFVAGKGPRRNVAVRFVGEDRLVTLDGARTLRTWRHTGGSLQLEASHQLRAATGRAQLADLHAVGEIAVLDKQDGSVRFFDVDGLAAVKKPGPFNRRRANCLFASPDGTRVVAAGGGFIEVIDLGNPAMVTVADRPLGAATPADLHAVTGHLDRTTPDAPARPILELLRACLVHRFGADVAIGDAMIVGRADDIALGGGG